eukprot:3171074-Alexandrium_andersonii.AAC.1
MASAKETHEKQQATYEAEVNAFGASLQECEDSPEDAAAIDAAVDSMLAQSGGNAGGKDKFQRFYSDSE